MANETILIVDADTKSQKVLEVSFKKAGYRVYLTDSPLGAKRRIASELPDIIISDTSFADGDGFELLASLKEESSTRNIPFIFLTEERSLPQKMRGFELGVDDYLTKPVYIKEVTTRVDLLLQKRAKELLSDTHVDELEGELKNITMIDLLQTIEKEARSGSIRLSRGSRQGVVYFSDGDIRDAICGKLQGEEAIYRLMLWPEGHFILRYHDISQRVDRVEKDASALLIEGIKRQGVWDEVRVRLPKMHCVFEADYQSLPELLESLPNEVGRVLRLFDGFRTLRDVVEDSPLDDVTTLKIVEKLLGENVLQDVTPANQREEQATQTNLAAWLENRSPEPDAEIGLREDTSPKFGAIQRNGGKPRATVEGSEEATSDEDADQLAGDAKGGFTFHFDDEPNHTDAIRKIEEDERVRQEAEARQLAGGAATLQLVPAVDRDSGPKKTIVDQIEEYETQRRAEEAKQLSQGRVGGESGTRITNMGFGRDEDSGDSPREARVTQPLRDAIDRNAGELARIEDVAPDPRRRRNPTPISTPALADPSLREPEVESETAEETRPGAADKIEVPARESTPTHDYIPVPTAEFEIDDEVDSAVVESSKLSPEELERLMRAELETADHNRTLDDIDSTTPFDPTDEMARLEEDSYDDDKVDTLDPLLEQTMEELSEADAFADDEDDSRDFSPFPGDLGLEDEAEPENRRERVTQDIRPPTDLYPIGASPAENEDTPDPFEDTGRIPKEPNLEESTDEIGVEDLPLDAVYEIEPLVARQSIDNEIVTAEYDLTQSGSPVSKTAAAEMVAEHELEREKESAPELEEPTENLTPDSSAEHVARDSGEHSFFATDSGEFPAAHDDAGAKGRIFLAVFGIAIIALIYVIATSKKDDPIPDPEPDPPAIAVVEPDLPEPLVDEPPPTAPTEETANERADLVLATSEDTASIMGGSDLLEADAGAPDMGSDAGEKPEEIVVAIAPEEKPDEVKPEEKPDEVKPEEKPDEVKPEEKPEKAVSDDKTKVAKAHRLVKREKYDEALKILDTVGSDNGKAAFLRGQIAFGTRKTSDAIPLFEKSIRLGYSPASLFLDLAGAYQLDGQNAKAKTAYERYLKLKPNGKVADEVRGILKTL